MRADWKRIFIITIYTYLVITSGCAKIYHVKTHQEIEKAVMDFVPLPDSLLTLPEEGRDVFGIGGLTNTEVFDYSIDADGKLYLGSLDKYSETIYLNDDEMYEIQDLLLNLNNKGFFSITADKIHAAILKERTTCCLSLFFIGEWESARSLDAELPAYVIVLKSKYITHRVNFNAYHMKHIPILRECVDLIMKFFNEKRLGINN
jgi:hypothetical protein